MESLISSNCGKIPIINTCQGSCYLQYNNIILIQHMLVDRVNNDNIIIIHVQYRRIMTAYYSWLVYHSVYMRMCRNLMLNAYLYT